MEEKSPQLHTIILSRLINLKEIPKAKIFQTKQSALLKKKFNNLGFLLVFQW
jgi:hypothetical protein